MQLIAVKHKGILPPICFVILFGLVYLWCTQNIKTCLFLWKWMISRVVIWELKNSTSFGLFTEWSAFLPWAENKCYSQAEGRQATSNRRRACPTRWARWPSFSGSFRKRAKWISLRIYIFPLKLMKHSQLYSLTLLCLKISVFVVTCENPKFHCFCQQLFFKK